MLAEMNRIDFASLNDEQCWEAVVTRDRRYDGVFVTAVKSTRIFCRPSCPARTPRREVVTFYPDPASAQSAGFRPCKRCTPETQAADIQIVELAVRYLQDHAMRLVSLSELGQVTHVSPTHLQRVFRRVTGISPREYVEVCRLGAFKSALRESGSVIEAIFAAGYGSTSAIYERAGDQLGMTPLAFRGGGTGMHIRYTLAECYLGRLLVAATDRGVCAVSIGESDEFLVSMLHMDYYAAEIERNDAEMSACIDAIIAHLEGDQPSPEVPLDIQATAFQRRVWSALQAIPRGETRTYSEVAASLGDPKAARAVARACATNPVPLLIPCHRVVRQGGALGGYRWGLEIKERLLSKERNG